MDRSNCNTLSMLCTFGCQNNFTMHITLYYFIKMYFRFFILLLCVSLTAGSCKSPSGAKLINNPANKSKKTDTENAVKGSADDLNETGNQTNKKNCKPSFTLKDTTIQGRNTQNMMLETSVSD